MSTKWAKYSNKLSTAMAFVITSASLKFKDNWRTALNFLIRSIRVWNRIPQSNWPFESFFIRLSLHDIMWIQYREVYQAAMNREDRKETSAAAANGSFGREDCRLPSRSFPSKSNQNFSQGLCSACHCLCLCSRLHPVTAVSLRLPL